MNDLQRFISLQDELLSTLSRVLSSGEVLSDEYQALIASQLEWITQRIEELSQPQNPTPEQQETIDLLWNISGGDPQIFAQYASSFPDAGLQQLLSNPATMQQVIAQMLQQPPAPPAETTGFPESPISSSNVYGFQYDPKSKSLMVKFNGKDTKGSGPVYQYDNVPPEIYEAFSSGSVPATTDGANRWGRWWKGKVPSVGASAFALLNRGPFSYRKIG